ncbi:Mss4-like protein [Aspergillus avenaceus]|uniref:Mss4-like protein n=1 Tax=Aspergillus avenaceus TaxID=36643 RepID=A0A5N6TXE9_ASPAV|nr:Mss4-like protein [Aspergillus avenaceus]
MAIGSCFCGNIRIEYNSQPISSGLCHCRDCRKLTGSTYSYSLIVKTPDLNVSGNPKEVAKNSDSGNDVRNYFCPDCGTPLFGHKVNSDGTPTEITVVRAGIFNDQMLNEWKPHAEIYTDRRLSWICPLEGAGQFRGMIPLS